MPRGRGFRRPLEGGLWREVSGRVTLDRSATTAPARGRASALGASSGVGELPSVALTQRFLALCEHHGSQRLAVRLVAVGRSVGVSGLPASNDWTGWDAEEMRAAVDYLEQMRVR